MAEAIGTMIQNIKYISIYKYTAEGWGGGRGRGLGEGPEEDGLWVWVSQKRGQG